MKRMGRYSTGVDGVLSGWAAAGALLLSTLLAGCSGLSQMREEPLDRGDLLEFDVDADRLTAMSKRALENAGYDLEEEQTVDGGRRILLGTMSGDCVRLIITPEGTSNSTLLLYNVRGMNGDILAFRRKVHWYLHRELLEGKS